MTVPRPASEHARETALEIAATALSRHTSWAKYELEFALQTLASALAVVEQERDQLREALEATKRFLVQGGGYSGRPADVGLLALVNAALAVPSSEPAGEPEA